MSGHLPQVPPPQNEKEERWHDERHIVNKT